MHVITTQGIFVAVTNLFNYSGRLKKRVVSLQTYISATVLNAVGKEFNWHIDEK